MRGKRLLKRASSILPVVVLLGVAALWVVNCSGPHPSASDPKVTAPSAPHQPYHVTARVENDGPGHGQVEIIFRLRDTQSGRVYQQSEKVMLRSGETVVVGVDINAPPGDYRPEVTINYPP